MYLKSKPYKIYTIYSGLVIEGAGIDRLKIARTGYDIPAIIVGRNGNGRGSSIGAIVVDLMESNYPKWNLNQGITIKTARIGSTTSGRPKLYESDENPGEDKAICVFRSKRGAVYTGMLDESESIYQCYRGAPEYVDDFPLNFEKMEEIKQEFGVDNSCFGVQDARYKPFPGTILEGGKVCKYPAQENECQIIATVLRDQPFRIGYSPYVHHDIKEFIYVWNGESIEPWSENEKGN